MFFRNKYSSIIDIHCTSIYSKSKLTLLLGEHEVATAISTVSKQFKILKRNENEIGNFWAAETNVTFSTAANIIMQNQNELPSSNTPDESQSEISIYNMTSHTHASKYTELFTLAPKLVRNNSGLVCHDPSMYQHIQIEFISFTS